MDTYIKSCLERAMVRLRERWLDCAHKASVYVETNLTKCLYKIILELKNNNNK